jgi:hypothetical protein
MRAALEHDLMRFGIPATSSAAIAWVQKLGSLSESGVGTDIDSFGVP